MAVLWLLLVAIAVGYGGLIDLFGLAEGGSSRVSEQIESDPVLAAFMAVLIAPVLEELVFRSWLRGSGKGVAAILALAVVGAAAFAVSNFIPPRFGPLVAIAALFAAFPILAAIAAARARPFRRRFLMNYKLVFWASVLLFGGVHLFNFVGYGWFTPLFLVPQTVLGIVLGYVRVRQGLRYAMALHVAYNGALIALAYAIG